MKYNPVECHPYMKMNKASMEVEMGWYETYRDVIGLTLGVWRVIAMSGKKNPFLHGIPKRKKHQRN